MPSRVHWFHGRLMELSVQECLDLLAAHSVGRVAFVDEDGPSVVPVNYVLVGGSVLFRTDAGGTLARHLDGSMAAFELDDSDEYDETGWSVLLRGRASYVDPETLLLDDESLPYPWPTGERRLLIQLRPDTITGRRLLPG